MNDDGAVSVLMLAMLGLAGLFCLATIDAAGVLVARARAQTAADAAALAAVSAQLSGDDPTVAAGDLATRNGGTLESCSCEENAQRATVLVSAPTHARMLGIAPRRVERRAEASLDLGRIFEHP